MEENRLSEATQQEETQMAPRHFEIWSNAKRAKNLLIIFWIVFGITILAAVSDYYELLLLNDLSEGKILSDEVMTNSDTRQQVLAVIQIVALIVSAVFFVYWFRRAYGNLDRINKSPEHSDSMAIWAFAIPFISFVRPPQMMFEIWDKTQAKIKEFDSNYTIEPNRYTIIVWWLLFIVTHMIGRYIMKSAFSDQQTIEGIISTSQAYMVSDILQVIEAFFVIVIVNNVSEMENKLADEVNRNGGDVVFF